MHIVPVMVLNVEGHLKFMSKGNLVLEVACKEVKLQFLFSAPDGALRVTGALVCRMSAHELIKIFTNPEDG